MNDLFSSPGMEISESDMERLILRKLLGNRIIGGKHTSIDNVPKGFPKHLRKDMRNAALRLGKKGILLMKQTNYGLEVSIRPESLPDVKQMVYGQSD